MNYLAVLAVSVALGMDAFSLALSMGLTGITAAKGYLVIGAVTLFHILMPLAGLFMGTYLGRIAGPMAETIGALILVSIGLHTVLTNLGQFKIDFRKSPPKTPSCRSLTKEVGWTGLILLAGCVSVDALTVGFGLGALEVDLLLTVITMGVVAGLMTTGGLFFGTRLNSTLGDKAEILGGVILMVIGFKLLI